MISQLTDAMRDENVIKIRELLMNFPLEYQPNQPDKVIKKQEVIKQETNQEINEETLCIS